MYQIFICEDQIGHRQMIETMIHRGMLIEDLDYQLVISTSQPSEILDYLMENPNPTSALYFLDIELDTEINGIQLGAAIRQHDDLGRIIYITGYQHYAPLTFKYKVEAFDFINKGDLNKMQAAISQTIKEIEQRNSLNAEDKKVIVIKDLYRTLRFAYRDILYFTTTDMPHIIEVVLSHGFETFYGSLREIEEESSIFIKVHQSYVVNKDNIDTIDYKQRIIRVKGGLEIPGSVRYLRKLKKIIS